MNAKLTLRLDEQLIKYAKEYSAKIGKPVSRIVADLFEVIKNENIEKENMGTQAVKSLRGILKHHEIDEKDYEEYLDEKFS